MTDECNIDQLLELEAELTNEAPSLGRDAKVNLLKYLQIRTVKRFESAYDDLQYELSKEEGLERLRNIAPARSEELLQPKVLEPQDCNGDTLLAKQLRFYLADAKLAKQSLDELVKKVLEDLEGCEFQDVEVKSLKSTRRKASKFCGGDVRKVTDMARVSVVCDKPEDLERVYRGVPRCLKPQEILRVTNGFNSGWMPSGYRDVKVNPVVHEHLCEIQLQLRDFYKLKGGQHAVYEWARELNVTTEMEAEHLFKNLSSEVTEEMIRLAGHNWHGTGYCLIDFQLNAGQYAQAEEGRIQELSQAENVARGIVDNNSTEWRQAMLDEASARAKLGNVLQLKGKHAEADPEYLRAIEIEEETRGPDHPSLARRLNDRAVSLDSQGRHAEAELLVKRSKTIREKALGPEHPAAAQALNNQAMLLRGQKGRSRFGYAQDKYEEAHSLYLRALEIGVKALGPEHPTVAKTLSNRAGLLTAQGEYAEAEVLYKRSHTILEKAMGPRHPYVAQSLFARMGLFQRQGKYAEAEPLNQLAQAIEKRDFGQMLASKGKNKEADSQFLQAIEIVEETLGSDHPDVAAWLNDRAGLLTRQGKHNEALPLLERALGIKTQALGESHQDTVKAQQALEVGQRQVKRT